VPQTKLPPANAAESTLMHKTLRLAAIWVATWAFFLIPDLLLSLSKSSLTSP
jgi:hypothetical protein